MLTSLMLLVLILILMLRMMLIMMLIMMMVMMLTVIMLDLQDLIMPGLMGAWSFHCLRKRRWHQVFEPRTPQGLKQAWVSGGAMCWIHICRAG